MNTTLRQRLLDQGIAITGHVRPVADAIERKDRELVSQVERARDSVAPLRSMSPKPLALTQPTLG